MPKVVFQPSGKTLSVRPGSELLDVARQADVEVDSPCGGKGACGKCVVNITAGEVDSDSLSVLPAAAVAAGHLLACRTRILDTPVVVEVPQQAAKEEGQIPEEDETYMIRGELLPKEWEFDPLAVKWLIKVPPAQLDDGLSDVERLVRAIQLEWGRKEKLPLDSLRLFEDLRSMLVAVEVPLGAIVGLAETLRAHGGLITVTMVRAGRKLHVVRVEPGHEPDRHHAIAVDVGTTTVTVQLIDLANARILATRSGYNNQVTCGLDVISRINYALKSNGLDVLRSRALETVNTLIDRLCRQNEITSQNIYSVYISGNTTMTHLLLGLDPQFIRIAPYTPTIYQAPNVTAVELAIQVHPLAPVLVSPCVGSYVGGDIAAGLLCSDLAYDGETISLYMDIGTNGELVLGNRDFLVACACSAGPAFEGGGLGCGMRAAYGAIDSVEIDPQSGLASYTTVGNGSPRGICGSGVISLLSKLFLTGWLDPSGKLNRDRPSPAIRIAGRRARYILVPAENSHTGQPIYLTEVDIEHIIRAKAAVYAACKLMLDQVGITFLDIATVYISGGFGRFLDINSAKVIGLIPDLSNDTFRYLGNASLIGTYMVLVSEKHRRLLSTTARRMTYMELNTDPSYMDQYSAALFLPHTDLAFFPSVRPRRNDDENVDT